MTIASGGALPQDGFDARDMAQIRVMLTRNLTRSGNYPNLPVTLGVTSFVVPFTLSEGDTLYGVKVVPNWNTTVWVEAADKTVDDCRVRFGTMAPAGATMDFSTFRSEV